MNREKPIIILTKNKNTMSNTQGKINLFTIIVDEGKEEEALMSILQIDSDFDNKKKNKKTIKEICENNSELEDRIQAVIDYSNDDGNQFLIGNQTYCSNYEVNIVRTDDNTQVVAIAYIT